MMRGTLWAFFLVVFLGCASCGVVPEDSPTFRATVAAIEQAYEDGHYTAEQRDALIEALRTDYQSVDWLELLVSLIGGGLLGMAGVRAQRGKPTQKVGLPSDKVYNG